MDSADLQQHTTIHVLSECGRLPAEIAELLGISQPEVEAALHQDRWAIAARFLKKRRKISFEKVAEALNMSEARVHSAVQAEHGQAHAGQLAGRLLGSSLQTRLDELSEEDSEMCCPITLMLFREPVIASDGFIYEADSMKALVKNRQVSPITREVLKGEYYPARQKKSEVMGFRETRAEALLQFASDAMDSDPRMTGTALDRVMEYLEVLTHAQVPALARKTTAIWEQTGRPLPDQLRPFVGLSERL